MSELTEQQVMELEVRVCTAFREHVPQLGGGTVQVFPNGDVFFLHRDDDPVVYVKRHGPEINL